MCHDVSYVMSLNSHFFFISEIGRTSTGEIFPLHKWDTSNWCQGP